MYDKTFEWPKITSECYELVKVGKKGPYWRILMEYGQPQEVKQEQEEILEETSNVIEVDFKGKQK